MIDDPKYPARDRVRRLLLCSGKIYFTLEAARKKAGRDDVAIVRVEQFYPFPKNEIQAILAKYRNATEIGWVQEEPQNRGAWTFMSDRLQSMLPETAVAELFRPRRIRQPRGRLQEDQRPGRSRHYPAGPRPPRAPPTEPKPVEASDSRLVKVAQGSGLGGD